MPNLMAEVGGASSPSSLPATGPASELPARGSDPTSSNRECGNGRASNERKPREEMPREWSDIDHAAMMAACSLWIDGEVAQ